MRQDARVQELVLSGQDDADALGILLLFVGALHCIEESHALLEQLRHTHGTSPSAAMRAATADLARRSGSPRR
jgi:hypothetical protein